MRRSLPLFKNLAVVGEFGIIHQMSGVNDSVLHHASDRCVPGSSERGAYTDPKKMKIPW
jgi:hypothetical protein